MTAWQSCPEIGGEIDGEYLADAVGRAGESEEPRAVEIGPLAGADRRFSTLRFASGPPDRPRYVLKCARPEPWRDEALGLGGGGGEVGLWLTDTLRGLPSPVFAPIVDIAYHRERDEIWTLMRDLTSGLVRASEFDEARTVALFTAVSALHAAYWDRDDLLDRQPLPGVAEVARAAAEPFVRVVERGERACSGDDWIAAAATALGSLRDSIPIFLELIGSREADALLELCQERAGWVGALERQPRTLVHGALEPEHVAFLGDRLALLDWRAAAAVPAVIELQRHWFRQFWAEPERRGRGPEQVDRPRTLYLEALERRLRRTIDRETFDAGWELAWVLTIVERGYMLARPLASAGHTRDDIERIGRWSRDAMARVRRAVDGHVR